MGCVRRRPSLRHSVVRAVVQVVPQNFQQNAAFHAAQQHGLWKICSERECMETSCVAGHTATRSHSPSHVSLAVVAICGGGHSEYSFPFVSLLFRSILRYSLSNNELNIFHAERVQRVAPVAGGRRTKTKKKKEQHEIQKRVKRLNICV